MIWICRLCELILYETLLVPILMSGNETRFLKEKGRSRIRAVQTDNLRGLLGIMGLNKS